MKTNKIRKIFIRIQGKTERFSEDLKEKKVLCLLVVFLLSALLALPVPFIASTKTVRHLDYMLDDALFQHEQKTVNPNIIVIKITEDDISECGGLENIPASIGALCDSLNSEASRAPSVIAIDTDNIVKTSNSVEALFRGVKGDNIVIGIEADSRNVTFLEDSLLSGKPGISISEKVSYTNLFFDVDGKVRHYAYSIADHGEAADSFAKRIIDTYIQNSSIVVPEIKLSSDNSMPICYMHPLDDYNCCTLSDMMNGNVSSDVVSGKLIFIGVSDELLQSGYFTSFNTGSISSNLEIQLNVVDSILCGLAKQDMPILIQNIILWLVATAMIMLVIYMKNMLTWVSFVVIAIGSVVGGFIFWKFGYIYHPMRCILMLVVTAFIAVIRFLVHAQYKSEKLNRIISHYVDQNIIEEISNNQEDEDPLHGSKKKIAVMFADIRNFTSMSELVGADESVEILNSILTIASECIMASGGTLDKYIGDCIMAFWGAPKDCEDAAYVACKTALEMVERVKPLCDEIGEKYNRAMSFGIGINYGEAVVGNIGSEDRMDYTAIGDTVNLASRLEGDAPGGAIYVSESIFKELQGRGKCRMLSKTIRIKGKINPVTVYSLYGLTEDGESVHTIETKREMDFYYNIKFFGTRGSFPVSGVRFNEFGGHTTCMILKRDDHAIVVDCGTGLCWAADYIKDCKHIDVLFSHMHYDHIMGLLDFEAFPKDCEVKFYGTFSEWNEGRVLDDLFSDPFWPANPGYKNIIDVKREQKYSLYDGTSVCFFNAPHPNHSSLITIESPTKKRICVMVDCESPEGLPFAKVSGADLLVYDGMYAPDDYEAHKGYGHSTFKAGCSLASLAHVRYLIITHHNPRYTDSKLLEMEKEAKLLYPDMSFARDGAEYVL